MNGRRFISRLTALMVLYAAVFCACLPAAHAGAWGAAGPVGAGEHAAACHGHGAPSETPTDPGAPEHPGGCDCGGVATVVEVVTPITLATPLEIFLPPVVASVFSEAEAPTDRADRLDGVAEDERPPGASGSLLRQRCALNL